MRLKDLNTPTKMFFFAAGLLGSIYILDTIWYIISGVYIGEVLMIAQFLIIIGLFLLREAWLRYYKEGGGK